MMSNNADHAPDITAVEDLIRQRLSAAKAQGLMIRPNYFGLMGACGEIWQADATTGASVCLIGAVLIGQVRTQEVIVLREFGNQVGWTIDQVSLLMSGFDRFTDTPLIDVELKMRPYFALGQKFRREVDAGLWR